MVMTRGSCAGTSDQEKLGLSDAEIREWIATEVVSSTVRGMISRGLQVYQDRTDSHV